MLHPTIIIQVSSTLLHLYKDFLTLVSGECQCDIGIPLGKFRLPQCFGIATSLVSDGGSSSLHGVIAHGSVRSALSCKQLSACAQLRKKSISLMPWKVLLGSSGQDSSGISHYRHGYLILHFILLIMFLMAEKLSLISIPGKMS